MIINEMTLWLLGVAILFTAVGWFFGTKNHMEKTTELTIDHLIEEGYLKTRGKGKDMVVLKWREWERDKTN